MGRPIKFRAWSNEHNRYCDFVTLDENGRWIGWIKSCGVYLTTVDIILEQDTGVKDKNGKEIYGGDIVEYDWYIVGDKPAYRVNSVVDFDYKGAMVGNNRLWKCTNIEVIGNIHENPELLEDKNGES